MIIFNLKHHQSGTVYQNPHFFILNKGLNTGKPLSEPCPNCFVATFQDDEGAEDMKNIVFSLWKVNFWHKHLIGSVIPYIRIKDFDKILTQKAAEMMEDFEAHKKNIAAMKALELHEKKYLDNLVLINDMRRVVMHRYCK